MLQDSQCQSVNFQSRVLQLEFLNDSIPVTPFAPNAHTYHHFLRQAAREITGRKKKEDPYWYILIRWHVSALQAEIPDQATAPKIPDMVTDAGGDLISLLDSNCQSRAAEEATQI